MERDTRYESATHVVEPIKPWCSAAAAAAGRLGL